MPVIARNRRPPSREITARHHAKHAVEHGLQIAVAHGGDSDSTGAVAGNLLGLLHPAETLYHPWQSEIECADLIDCIARDLAAAREPGNGFAEDYWDRYPGF